MPQNRDPAQVHREKLERQKARLLDEMDRAVTVSEERVKMRYARRIGVLQTMIDSLQPSDAAGKGES